MRRSQGEEDARRIFPQGLAFFGIWKETLALLKKGDAPKLAIANAIRLDTVVPNAWIAQEFELEHISRVSLCWNAGIPSEGYTAFLAALEK